jgi:hypothetical protein
MLKKIFTPLFLLFPVVTILSSCSKRDVISNEYDVVGTWAVTGIRSNVANDWDGNGSSETDIYGTYSSCQRDIVLTFDEYGTGQARQGCNAYWQNINWQVTNNNHNLHIDLMDDAIDLSNLRVTSNTIQGDDNVYSNGRNYTVTYTLQRR